MTIRQYLLRAGRSEGLRALRRVWVRLRFLLKGARVATFLGYAGRRFLDDDGMRLASGLSYASLLAMVPLLAIAGRDDRIVSIRAAREIMRLAGSSDKHFEVLPGGHAGVFAGGRAPEYGWRMIADWLSPLSDD